MPRLMEMSDENGGPIVATGRMKQYKAPVYGLVVAMTGREKDVEEILDLLRAKYPNSEVPSLRARKKLRDPRRTKPEEA